MDEYKVVLIETSPSSEHSCSNCIFFKPDTYLEECREPSELNCKINGIWTLEKLDEEDRY